MYAPPTPLCPGLTTPKLASFLADPSQAGASLTPAFDYAKEKLAGLHFRDIPVFVRATAGLRESYELFQENTTQGPLVVALDGNGVDCDWPLFCSVG